MKIGFIGQGFVGKSMADDYENRGYDVVRYSLEAEYVANKDTVSECEIVFVAVPTPTTSYGFDYGLVDEVLGLVGSGSTAVIKSTLLPGTTKELQEKHQDILVMHSPEFLSEKTAAKDAANPIVNVIGIPSEEKKYSESAKEIQATFPVSEHNFIVSAQAAELFKYAHNLNGYFRIILTNLLFEVGVKTEVKWKEVEEMMDADEMMSPYYNSPEHKGGRGAGGNCFIKDMAAFRHMYTSLVDQDKKGLGVFKALEDKNIELLQMTGKDQEILNKIYK